jgi:hypothetical protein
MGESGMKQCEQCGKPLNRGSTNGAPALAICIICQVDAVMAAWHYQPHYAATNAKDRPARNRVQYHKRKMRAAWKPSR